MSLDELLKLIDGMDAGEADAMGVSCQQFAAFLKLSIRETYNEKEIKSMTNYPKLIDILTSEDTDFRQLVINIAKTHPDAVIEAFHSPWMGHIDALLQSAQKLEAIKLWRHHTGTGLKEAKDAVDVREKELGIVK